MTESLIGASEAIHKVMEPLLKAHGLDDFIVIALKNKGKKMLLISSIHDDGDRADLLEEAIGYLGQEPDEIVQVQ
jgi:hypothetical protein